MARLGFDWLVVDMEHTAHNAVLMADMVATIADAGTCAPIVRVPTNSVGPFTPSSISRMANGRTSITSSYGQPTTQPVG